MILIYGAIGNGMVVGFVCITVLKAIKLAIVLGALIHHGHDGMPQ